MNGTDVVNFLYERARTASSPEERFIAEFLQFFLMDEFYAEPPLEQKDTRWMEGDVQGMLCRAFRLLAVPVTERESGDERRIFEQFQDRYAAVFFAFPQDPAGAPGQNKRGDEALCRAMNVAKKLLAEIFAEAKGRGHSCVAQTPGGRRLVSQAFAGGKFPAP